MGKVSASIDTTHRRGPIAQAVEVTTNDPARRVIILVLKGEVVATVEVQPSENVVIRGPLGALKPAEVTVFSVQGRPFDVMAIEADPSVTVSVAPAPQTGGTEPAMSERRPAGTVAAGASRYLVTIAPRADIPVGRSAATVTLRTNHPEGENVPLNVNFEVASHIRVSPTTLVLTPPGTLDEHVNISKREGEKLKILGVESSNPDFIVTANSVTEGREYDLVVRYAGKASRDAVRSQITVKTNDPHQNAIAIPVVGYIAPVP